VSINVSGVCVIADMCTVYTSLIRFNLVRLKALDHAVYLQATSLFAKRETIRTDLNRQKYRKEIS